MNRSDGRRRRPILRALTTAAGASAVAGAWLAVLAPQDGGPRVTVVSVGLDDGPAELPEVREEFPEAILSLRQGRDVRGLLVDRDEDRVVLRISGIDTPFSRDDVEHVRVLAPVMERFHSMRAAVPDNDTEGRILLVEWLREREHYEEALAEVKGVLELEPHNRSARTLHTWLAHHVDLRARRIQRDRPAAAPEDAERRRRGSFPLLRDDEINMIRVYEVDLRNPPRLLISRETRQRLLTEYAEHELVPTSREGRESLLRQRPARVLELMFRVQARELYPEVRVLENPHSMELFRDTVHRTWLLNSCSTTRCHGGQEAGRLFLNHRRPNSDPTVYTNFFILDNFRLPDGTPLINYTEPSRSPLLHMGLPRDSSLYPHPEVRRTRGARGWSPIFRSTEDMRFRQAVRWIESMYKPRPDYGIEYTPPRPGGLLFDDDEDVEIER